MRIALSLLGGIAISGAGLLVVLASTQDLAGVLLIAAGAIVALLSPRALRVQPPAD
jgi:hypothetical protein